MLKAMSIILMSLISLYSEDCQGKGVIFGAYYFGGWSSVINNQHLSPRLTKEFKDRKPVWGWNDDKRNIIEMQLDLAHGAGIKFFIFNWYWPPRERDLKGLHNAMNLYRKAPNKSKVKYCVLLSNHEGGEVGPREWEEICKEWIILFKDENYIKIDKKPMVVVFDPRSLFNKFGRDERELSAAIQKLDRLAVANGFDGVHIGACALPGPENSMDDLVQLGRIGFRFFTNYNLAAFPVQGGRLLYPYKSDREYLFEHLVEGHEYIWNKYTNKTALPYYPVVTTGWDKRPWENADDKYGKSVYYVGRTPEKVGKFIENAIRWVDNRYKNEKNQKIIILYAWNELGEGGYLVPTVGSGDSYIKMVANVINSSKSGSRLSEGVR